MVLLCRRHRVQCLRGIVRGRVDPGADFIEGQQLGRKGREECLRLIQGATLVEPGCLITGVQDHGHTVVELGHEGVRLGGEDGKGRIGMAAGIVHRAPDASKSKRCPTLESNPVGPLALASAFPLIKAIG